MNFNFGESEAQWNKDFNAYLLSNYPENYFDCLIDIGACYGYASIRFNALNPSARIFAYEPCESSYSICSDNFKKIPNAIVHNVALGDGNDLYFAEAVMVCDRRPGSTLFLSEDTTGIKVASKTLEQIFEEHNILGQYKRICLKIDCEGGERFLLKNTQSTQKMLQCDHIAIEVHFPTRRHQRFMKFPQWIAYDTWIKESFKEFSILYHNSNKYSGLGTYVLRKKQHAV